MNSDGLRNIWFLKHGYVIHHSLFQDQVMTWSRAIAVTETPVSDCAFVLSSTSSQQPSNQTVNRGPWHATLEQHRGLPSNTGREWAGLRRPLGMIFEPVRLFHFRHREQETSVHRRELCLLYCIYLFCLLFIFIVHECIQSCTIHICDYHVATRYS